MKYTILLSLFGLLGLGLFFGNCKKERVAPCTKVTCKMGNCINGTCDCLPGYKGIHCDAILPPTAVVIKSINITQYPMIKEDGSSWDSGIGSVENPDPYITFHCSTATNLDSISNYTNVTGEPLLYELNSRIEDPTSIVVLHLLDKDYTINGNDTMAFCSFKPADLSTFLVGFPSSVDIQSSKIKATLQLEWSF